MVKSTNKAQRKLSKMLSRVGASGGDFTTSSAVQPDGALSPRSHLQTNDERLAAKHPQSEVARRTMGKKKQAKKASSSGPLRAARHRSSNNDDSNDVDGEGTAVARQAVRKLRSAVAANITSAGRHQKSRAMAAVGASQKKKRTRPERAGASARMSQAHEALDLFDKIVAVPAFQSDPFGAIGEHLASTMAMLQPQTPDVGRMSP